MVEAEQLPLPYIVNVAPAKLACSYSLAGDVPLSGGLSRFRAGQRVQIMLR